MPHLSIATLSAFNLPRKGKVSVVLKAYYDGSGKSNDRGCRYVTLAGYVAPGDQWQQIESLWETALLKHPRCPLSDRGNPYFHAKEVFHSKKGFLNWTAKEIQDLLSDLYNVLGAQGRMGMIGFSCTVRKKDYEVFKVEVPGVRSIETMCVDHCLSNSFRHPNRGNGMEIYGDRDEPFLPILDAAWRRKVNGKRTDWASEVLHVGPVEDMRYSYALQCADLLAWTANRYYTHGSEDLYGRNFFVLHLLNAQCHFHYGEEQLRKTFNDDGTMRRGVMVSSPPITAPKGTRLSVALAEE